MKAMKLLDVGSDDVTLAKYIADPEWVMQQKHDGARMVAVYENGALRFLNQQGQLMTFAAAAQKMPELQAHLFDDIHRLGIVQLILDGEIMPGTGVYHVWDAMLLRVAPTDDSEFNINRIDGSETWEVRDRILRTELGGLEGSLVQFAITARTPGEKADMWKTVQIAQVEGAVSKWIHSTWDDDGSRTKHWVKHKLVKTGDVVVTKVDRTFDAKGMVTHGSAELSVPIAGPEDPKPYVNAKNKRISIAEYAALTPARQATFGYVTRELLPVGNASLIGKELTIDVGSVVEVRYLYFTGDALVQPAILRERFDKFPMECDLAQFPAYTRAIVTL
jgi:ATP-dependent DNA ligase